MRAHSIFLAAICWTIVSLGCTAEVASRVADVRAAVSSAWEEHIDAAKRKDAGAVVEIYADDVIYFVPGGPIVSGRQAIDAMEAQTLAENDLLDATHTIESLRVFGDVAYEIGTVAGPIRPRGKSVVSVTFHFMAMWQLQADGAWRIRHFSGQPE